VTSESATPTGEPTAVEDRTAEAAEMPTDAPPLEGDGLDPQDQRLSAEAARWRREFRSAETKLTAAETREAVLAARVAELQRAEINRAVATKPVQADDIWLWPGVDLDQFIVDGEVDLDAALAKAE